MPLIQVKKKAQVTIPVKLRKLLGIKEGDYLEAEVKDNKIILTPQVVLDQSDLAVLSKKGDRMIEEALSDVKADRVKEFDDVEDLIKELRQ